MHVLGPFTFIWCTVLPHLLRFRYMCVHLVHLLGPFTSIWCTVKAQYKNNPDFGKGACCSYDLLAQALVPKEEQQVILKGAQLSGT